MTAWTAIVPVKPWRLAKSRLGLPDHQRVALARAFALDVLETVAEAGVARIVVVTAEESLALHARSMGATVLRDRPLMAPGMLNCAIDQGRRRAAHDARAHPVVVVPSDLPAMTPAVLAQTLHELASHDKGHVPDASGVGTTLLAAARPSLLVPLYGTNSCRRHDADGSFMVPHVDPRVRRDVDLQSDLAEATRLGLARHTADCVESIGSAAYRHGHHLSMNACSSSGPAFP